MPGVNTADEVKKNSTARISDKDLQAFVPLQEQTIKFLEQAIKKSHYEKKRDGLNSVIGVVSVLGGLGGWYLSHWYVGMFVLVLVMVAMIKLVEPIGKQHTKDVLALLRPKLTTFIKREGIAGFAALLSWSRDSSLPRPTSQFIVENTIYIDDLVEKIKKRHPDLAKQTQVYEELFLQNEKKIKSEEDSENAIAVPQANHPDSALEPRLQQKAAASAAQESVDYKAPSHLYDQCRVKKKSNDLIVPPFSAGNLRFIEPPSSRILNAADIGGGLSVAFSNTHFIMKLQNSRYWRIGYDCIRSYRYAPKGAGLSSGREHELSFLIGLDHTYTNVQPRNLAGFGFSIHWWKHQGSAETFVPLIRQAIDVAPAPRCPGCGQQSLQIGTQQVLTSLFKGAKTIADNKALCRSCGLRMHYALSAGGWVADEDEDLCRSAAALSAAPEEMLAQAQDTLDRAESMLVAVAFAAKAAQVQVEKTKNRLRDMNVGGTLQTMMTTRRQKKIRSLGHQLQFNLAMLEFNEGVGALVFNFCKALEQLQGRIQADIEAAYPGLLVRPDFDLDEAIQRSTVPGLTQRLKLLRRIFDVSLNMANYVAALPNASA